MKQMVVYLDGSQNDRESLDFAVRFCQRLDGRLSVVHPRQPDQIDLKGRDVGTKIVVDKTEDANAAAAIAKQAYDEICGGQDFAEWHEIRGGAPHAIVQFGLFHDLTILERISNEEGPEVLAFNTALFETGGPVLVTPPDGHDGAVGEDIAVAWSPSLQSARAVRSAIPLLRKAKTVTIVTNGANKEADPAPLATYLAHNGIGAQFQSFSGAKLTARGRGRAILAAVAESGADLLVMGAYGENKLSAVFGLGRATRKVVTAIPIPLLTQS
jgi:nucleotide-binding universal stress UspA family protein